jgi:type I restriction enzyme S subunit
MSFPLYESYKDSGVEWLGEVPEHWAVKRLGFYFNERREKVSDKVFEPLSVTKNGILPQLETAAKTDDGDNRKKVCSGDFVINSRSDRKGSSGLAKQDGSVSLINTVLAPYSEIDGHFAHHLFRSVLFQEEFYRYGKGIVADGALTIQK